MLPFSVLGTTLATYCGQNLGAGKYNIQKRGEDQKQQRRKRIPDGAQYGGTEIVTPVYRAAV